jgi:hypothetical protein
MRITKKEKQIFWDYDLENIDLTDARIKIWFLSRKLRFGDLSGTTKKDLKKYLAKLNISPVLKELLRNYLKTNA